MHVDHINRPIRFFLRSLIFFVLTTWAFGPNLPRVHAAESGQTPLPPPATSQVDYARDIKPLFESRCYVCHGAGQQVNGLRLDRKEDALRGGFSGAVIAPGDSAASKLVHMVAGTAKGAKMPPVGEPFNAREIGLLRAWIDQGARWSEPADPNETAQAKATGSAEPSHWSFRPIERPALPQVQDRAWPRNAIDFFVLAKLESLSIWPSPEAEKTALIRRLALDLTGLPPTPEQVKEFLLDNRPDAYERLVDRFLDSDHYGEKWAMHWLDLARYADSDGYEKDLSRPHAWRYREWVINALNRDMPFDQFTLEQIAGDLLPNATTEQKVATGFHRNTLKNREGGVNIEAYRFEETIDRANTIGTVWLGLTVGCAQCHDHKYDPTTQKDYYSLLAFFNNIDEIHIDAPMAGELGPYLAARPEYDRKRREVLEEYKVFEMQPPWEARTLEAAKQPGVWTDWDLTYDVLPLYVDRGHEILHRDPAERTPLQTYTLNKFFLKNYHRVVPKERYEELKFKEALEKLDEIEKAFPALSWARVVEERPEPRPNHVHLRGQWDRLGIPVTPETPLYLPTLQVDRDKRAPSRVDLAEWLTSGENPLTARVTVNRFWQEYFGRGLVVTADDFGTQGEPPSHPKLLDWLASEFIERGWSLKHMHKLIVTSAAYRQSSDARPELRERDPNNVLLARQSRLRLPGELVRDRALSVSGLLYDKVGGKSVRPPLPAGVAELGYAGGVKWNESEGRDRYRRGLYIHFQRTVPYPFLMNFDSTERNTTDCTRERSNTPLQALNLLNDPVFFEASQALAARVLRETPDQAFNSRLDHAFLLTLSRKPSPSEQKRLSDFYQEQNRKLESTPEMAEKLFPARLEGVNRVETAAWVGLSRILLNLDEFITRE